MAKRRMKVELVPVPQDGVPLELLDVDAPEWSSWDAAAEWCAERGYQRPRGRLRPWFTSAMFHRQAVERWARDNGRLLGDGRSIDWAMLEAAGVPVVEVVPERWVFPHEVIIRAR